MSQSSNEFLKQREFDSQKFNGWEEFQMWRYGNVLKESSRHPVMIELSNQEPESVDHDYQNPYLSLVNGAQ